MTQRTGPVQSIDRVLDIIETLSVASRGMSLKDLAEAVNLHVSTVHRLVMSLAAREYVRKNEENGRYVLTTKLFEIGRRVINESDLVTEAMPQLDALAAKTDETIHLVAWEGTDVVYLYKEETRNRILTMRSHIGARRPMYCTAVGKSILAAMDEKDALEIWNNSSVEAITDNTITNRTAFLDELERTRARGYALDREENEIGVTCVAAAIKDFWGVPVGAVSISGPTIRMQEDNIKKYGELALDAVSKLDGIITN